MPRIHPSATVGDQVRLTDDVEVGPQCVLTGDISIGAGTRLLGHVYLQGPLAIGERNSIYPFVCLGFAPQHASYDPDKPGRGLVIGDDNVIREQVTMHRAFSDEHPTIVGNRNYFMATSHVAHDCRIGNDCTIVNYSAIAGHVEIDDRVMTAASCSIHQFCRVGRGAMLGAGTYLAADLPPYFMVTGHNVCGGVNTVGLRRSGMPRDQIDMVRWVYRTLYRSGLSAKHALEKLRERASDPLVTEYITFVESSKRGICPARGQGARGTGGSG
jgi:UDP-N-acetylglucosamine acyltransferase